MTSSPLRITVNGKPREVPKTCNLLEFLQEHQVNPGLVAIEYNGDVVRRERFGEIVLKEGDTVEIVHMVGGGDL